MLWVTSKASRHLVHQIRSTCDAVIIGGNTVRKDNPSLTTHGVTEHNPLRVVMSRSLDLPTDCNLWSDRQAKTLIFTENHDAAQQQKLHTEQTDIITVAALTPKIVMEHLYHKGISQSTLGMRRNISSKSDRRWYSAKVMAFIAPKIIGGTDAPSPVGDLNFSLMTDALDLKRKLQVGRSKYLN